ncbi:MAG: DNA ligase [Wolbachia endosymbiont of Dactylopius coccus]|nr:MAG: DNA ligase [Wolbachia endosymbiont of Dactylopius coccus]PBQ26889.1 DNA ligase [Wolbachia pipientis wAus]QEK90131.1 DNA ligase [Wolbachia endosymbiont of Chrysomya megacephala]
MNLHGRASRFSKMFFGLYSLEVNIIGLKLFLMLNDLTVYLQILPVIFNSRGYA